jgi:NifB/MoaA-like Fe-S oxidoreductase
MSPGVNDGPVLERTLGDLYQLGDPVLSVSVVPVGLTTYSKHDLCREPTRDECRAAVALVERWGEQARRERGVTWAYGADELYLRAELPLPPAWVYDGFEQVENGVGAVRFLQQRIAEDSGPLAGWAGRRIAVCTGSSMGALMPQVLEPLRRATGASFELLVLTNPLFGPLVTCAGLLPGAAFRAALENRSDFDLALIPAESLNEGGLFMDDLTLAELRAQVRVPVEPSRHFTDVLATSA